MVFTKRIWCLLILAMVMTSFVHASPRRTAKLEMIYRNSGEMRNVSFGSGSRDLSVFAATPYFNDSSPISPRWIVKNGRPFLVDAPDLPKLSRDDRTCVTNAGQIFCQGFMFGCSKQGRITLLDENFQQTVYNFTLPQDYKSQGPCIHPVLTNDNHVYFAYQNQEHKNFLVIWKLGNTLPIETHYLPFANEEYYTYIGGIKSTADGAILEVSRKDKPDAYYHFSKATKSFSEIISSESYCNSTLLSKDAHALVHSAYCSGTTNRKNRWFDVKTKTWTDIEHDVCEFTAAGLCLINFDDGYYFGMRNSKDFIALTDILKLYGFEDFVNRYDFSIKQENIRISALAADGSSLIFFARNMAAGHLDLFKLTFMVTEGNNPPRQEPLLLDVIAEALSYRKQYTGLMVEEVEAIDKGDIILSTSSALDKIDFVDTNAIKASQQQLEYPEFAAWHGITNKGVLWGSYRQRAAYYDVDKSLIDLAHVLAKRWRVPYKLESIRAVSDDGKVLLVAAESISQEKILLKITLKVAFWDLNSDGPI